MGCCLYLSDSHIHLMINTTIAWTSSVVVVNCSIHFTRNNQQATTTRQGQMLMLRYLMPVKHLSKLYPFVKWERFITSIAYRVWYRLLCGMHLCGSSCVCSWCCFMPTSATTLDGGPRAVVSTAAFHARVRGSVPGLGGLKETKNVSSPSTCESQYCGEPPWPRGSVLGLRPPEFEFRIMCHLNHLTILRRFSWPSLAYMCTKVA